MTKTLTEQWRDKELKDGDYYVLNKAGDIVCDYYIEILGHFDSVLTENVKEVLAPVPSYDEYKELTQRVGRLEFDKEVLEDVVQECNKRGLENKKLQEQLKEANAIIDLYFPKDKKINAVCVKPINDYREKWGVK